MSAWKLLVTVALVTAASLPSASQMISCYQCAYRNATDAAGSKCSEPFNPSSAPKCNSDMCYMKWFNENNDYTITRECLNSSLGITLDQCSTWGKQTNYSYFVYKKMCCHSTGIINTPSATTSTAQCWCQTNFCNGEIPFSSDTTRPPAENGSPITAQLLTYYPLLMLDVVIAVVAKTAYT